MAESDTGVRVRAVLRWVNSKPKAEECQDSQEGETGEWLLVVLSGPLPACSQCQVSSPAPTRDSRVTSRQCECMWVWVCECEAVNKRSGSRGVVKSRRSVSWLAQMSFPPSSLFIWWIRKLQLKENSSSCKWAVQGNTCIRGGWWLSPHWNQGLPTLGWFSSSNQTPIPELKGGA